MCPLCAVTIGGGLLVAGRSGAKGLLFIGISAIAITLAADFAMSKVLKGKKAFLFQKVVISAAALILATVTAQFLL